MLREGGTTKKRLTAIESTFEKIDEENGVFFGDAAVDTADGMKLRAFESESDTAATVTLVEDAKVGRYVEIAGPRARAIAGIVAKVLPVETPEELVARAANRRVALGVPVA